jgi:3-dehydroquinate synthase
LIKEKNQIKKLNFIDLVDEIEKKSTQTTLFIIDENIEKNYQLKALLESRLQSNSKRAITWIAKPGEPTKTLNEVERCCEFFLSQQITRQSVVFTIGGGATSDFGGFIASLLLRGLSWNSIPTSLLSMVDAALGGKVGVNSTQAKNLIGAFHSPDQVYLCCDFLKTLPSEERISGNGEILKYCFLDSSISELVLTDQREETILACLNFKKKIVDLDPFEANQRKILNLGHTLGHCLERMYALPHGVAVAWGIFLLLTIENNQSLLKKLKEFALKLDLDLKATPWGSHKLDLKILESLLKMDKKMTSTDEIDLILASDLGEIKIEKRKLDHLMNQLHEFNHDLG